MRILIISAVFILTVLSAQAEPLIRYGISSVLSASNTFIHYEEINSYIAEKMNVKSEIIHKENYSDMNRLIETQQVDFASICTGAMLYLKEESYTLVAVPEIGGKSTYQSFIIKNNDVEAKVLADLKGKTFAMTDRLSNTGFLFPTYIFTKNFYKPDFFFLKFISPGVMISLYIL